MDFVVSKVAMAICALLVVGVLSGAVGSQDDEMLADELESAVSQLCALTDRAVLSGAESSLAWSVPDTASGDLMGVTISRGVVRAASGDQERAGQPRCGVHTWVWNGVGLNESSIRALDSSSRPVEALSGERLLLRTEMVLVENEPTLLAFAGVAS